MPCHKDYEFTCKSGQCIPIYDACNSFEDCNDKSDELNCSKTTYPAYITKYVTQLVTSTSTTASTKTEESQIDKGDILKAGNGMYQNQGEKANKNKKPQGKQKNAYNPLEYPDDDEPYEEEPEILNELLKNQEDQNLLENLSENEYDEFRALKQQAEIVEHLKELENLKAFSHKKKIVQQSSDDFLNSFLKTSFYSSTRPSAKTTSKSLRTKFNFHGILNV